MLEVDKEDTDKDRECDHIDASERNALLDEKIRRQEPKEHIDKLYYRIAERDVLLAFTASAAEHNVGQERDVVIPTKLVATVRAMRIWLGKAHIQGQTVNYHV